MMVALVPVIEITAAELVVSLMPDIVHVPAKVAVIVPVIEMFGVKPSDGYATMSTPALAVTFSVTEFLRKIVSPLFAADNADANVV